VRADGQKPDRRREGRTSEPMIAKSISIKGPERRFGGCAPKAVELTSGDLSLCRGKPRGVVEATGGGGIRPDQTAEVSRGQSR